MKIRQGFVSNSSSTSFCIYGASFGVSEVEHLMDKKMSEEDTDDDWGYPTFEKFEKKVGKAGLVFYHCSEGEMVWAGRAPDTIADDETGIQFKDTTEKILEKLFKKPVDCEWHTTEIST